MSLVHFALASCTRLYALIYCCRWLDKGEDDGRLECELLPAPEEPEATPEPTGTKWSVTIRNGATKQRPPLDGGGDTAQEIDDSDVSDADDRGEAPGQAQIVIYGKEGCSDVIALPSANKLRFEENQTEQYEIFVDRDLTEVYKLRLYIDSKRKRVRWPVSYVSAGRHDVTSDAVPVQLYSNLYWQVLLQMEGDSAQLRFELNDVIRLSKRRDGRREIVLHREGDDGAVEPTLPG